jgi:hypothetical protein
MKEQDAQHVTVNNVHLCYVLDIVLMDTSLIPKLDVKLVYVMKNQFAHTELMLISFVVLSVTKDMFMWMVVHNVDAMKWIPVNVFYQNLM